MSLQAYIHVTTLVPLNKLSAEDKESAPGGLYVATLADDTPADGLANAALDKFHDEYGIETLDDFDITVRAGEAADSAIVEQSEAHEDGNLIHHARSVEKLSDESDLAACHFWVTAHPEKPGLFIWTSNTGKSLDEADESNPDAGTFRSEADAKAAFVADYLEIDGDEDFAKPMLADWFDLLPTAQLLLNNHGSISEDAYGDLLGELKDVLGANAANDTSDDPDQQDEAISDAEGWVSDQLAAETGIVEALCALWLKDAADGAAYIVENALNRDKPAQAERPAAA